MAQAFTAGFIDAGTICDRDQAIVGPAGFNALADGEDQNDFDAFLEAAALVDSHVRGASELAPAIVAMLNRAHALGAGTLGAGLSEIVESVLQDLDEDDLRRICHRIHRDFQSVAGVPHGMVDELRVFPDVDTLTGDADAWTMRARIRVDTDCGEDNVTVVFAGLTLPGRSTVTSITNV